MTPAASDVYAGIDSDELMSLVAAGDECAHNALCERWRGTLLSYFLRHTHGQARSADLAQSTLLKAWKEREQWPPRRARGASFRPWILAIAKNVLVDDCRREKRNAAAPGSKDPTETLPAIADPDPTPEDDMIGKETRDSIRNCIGQLEPLARQILKSRIYEDQTLEQIGSNIWPQAAGGAAISKTRRTLFEALLKVKKCLMAKGIETSLELGHLDETGGDLEAGGLEWLIN